MTNKLRLHTIQISQGSFTIFSAHERNKPTIPTTCLFFVRTWPHNFYTCQRPISSKYFHQLLFCNLKNNRVGNILKRQNIQKPSDSSFLNTSLWLLDRHYQMNLDHHFLEISLVQTRLVYAMHLCTCVFLPSLLEFWKLTAE